MPVKKEHWKTRQKREREEAEAKSMQTQSKPLKTTTVVTEPTDNPQQNPLASGGMRIIGNQVEGKGETRLYQTGADEKTWLTKEEAKAAGKYWKDEETAPTEAKAKKR